MIGGEDTINPLDLTQEIVFKLEVSENSSEHQSLSLSLSGGG